MTREEEFSTLLESVTAHLAVRNAALDSLPVTPTPDAVRATVAALPAALESQGWGTSATLAYIKDTLLPGCLTAQNGPRYFGFVTGGVTPAAQLADVLGSGYDENVQVTLPDTTAATAIEARTLELVLDLLDIPRDAFQGRTITTGATASNILGLGRWALVMLLTDSVRPRPPIRDQPPFAARVQLRAGGPTELVRLSGPPLAADRDPFPASAFLNPQSGSAGRDRRWSKDRAVAQRRRGGRFERGSRQPRGEAAAGKGHRQGSYRLLRSRRGQHGRLWQRVAADCCAV